MEEELRKLENNLTVLITILNGGKGSGNFGHAGRPGKKGGSAKSGTNPIMGVSQFRKTNDYKETLKDIVKNVKDYRAAEAKYYSVPYRSRAWLDAADEMYTITQKNEGVLKSLMDEASSAGFDTNFSKLKSALDDWSIGNDIRDKNGKYPREPQLSKLQNSDTMTLYRGILSDVYRKLGKRKIKVYRGQDSSYKEPKGLTSFTLSKSVARNFAKSGGKVIEKTVSVDDIYADDSIFRFSRHAEEEVIIDMGK